MNPKTLHPIVIVSSVLIAALLSGIVAIKGAIFSGHDPSAGWPFPDLTGLAIFLSATLACPVLSIFSAKLLFRNFPKSHYHIIVTNLLIPPLIAFPIGSIVYQWNEKQSIRDSLTTARVSQSDLAKNDVLQAILVSDPEIALRERWFAQKRDNEILRYLFTESLKKVSVNYSPDQLARIYKEAPDVRSLVVANPACDSAFLADHWIHALGEAQVGNDEILIAIVANPKTPRALLQNLKSSPPPFALGVSKKLKSLLDYRLYSDDLVISPNQRIQSSMKLGVIKIWANSNLYRSYEWDQTTRSTTLELVEKDPNGPIIYFKSSFIDNGQYNVTRRGEFREGRRNFESEDQAVQWIDQQSKKISTAYRHDGLLVSCDMDPGLNQLTVEIWQILIKASKPTSLPGADNTKIIVTTSVLDN